MTGAVPGDSPVEVCFTALGAAAVLTEVVRRVGLRHGMLDLPGDRKAHEQPTPQLGGVAIVLGTLIAITLYLHRWGTPLTAVVACAVAVSVLGLVDDFKPLTPGTRLQVEMALAALVVLAGVRLTVFDGLVGTVLTIGWIVVVTNSCNLLDNMDGSAAAVGSATLVGLGATALALGRLDYATVVFALAAACGGFLVHNWAPARIFMGDCGSLFLGFAISTMSVLIPSSANGPAAVVSALFFGLVPAVDTAVVMISRRSAGRPLLSGGTDHLSHRLCRLGLTTQQSGVALCALAGIASLTGMCVTCRWLPSAVALAAGAPVAAILTAAMLRVPVYPKPSMVGPGVVSSDVGNLGVALVGSPQALPDFPHASHNQRQEAQVGVAN